MIEKINIQQMRGVIIIIATLKVTEPKYLLNASKQHQILILFIDSDTGGVDTCN